MAKDQKNPLDIMRAGVDFTSAADALKRALGGSLASDALKTDEISSAAAGVFNSARAGGLKSRLTASIGKVDAAPDAAHVASGSPLSGTRDETHHLTDGRYTSTVLLSQRAADTLKQAEGSLQRDLPIARMQVPRPIKSPAALGQMVRQAREATGLTQAEFADLAGVGRRFISELENGKATLELGKVMAVCAAAGLDLLATPR